MSSLFHFDSPFMRKLTLVVNLAVLNLLWLICCIPIFTVGAATVAMHSVLFRYIEHTDDEVIRPFFRAFKQNFKQATCLWLVFLPILTLLGIDALFLYTNGSGKMALLWIPFAVVGLFSAAILSYVFPLLARYNTPTKQAVRNSMLLFLMEFWKSLFVLILNLLPWATMLITPQIVFFLGMLWLFFCGSLVAYFNDRILLHIFKKREYTEPANDECDTSLL